MLKSDENGVSIDIKSEDELVTELGALLIEVKRQLKFSLGREKGTVIYNAIVKTADSIK